MKIDWNRAAMLLHILNESRGYPKLDRMHKAALAELEEMCAPEPTKPEPKPEPDTAIQPGQEKKPEPSIHPMGSQQSTPQVDQASASEPKSELPRL